MNISDFKANLSGGGARSNHFSVQLSMPNWVGGSEAAREASFLCHAANLPASTLSDIEIPFRGRAVHVAGERTFEPWTVSIYNDTGFSIRNALEYWIEGISNTPQTNGIVAPLVYQSQMQVFQFDRNGNPIKEYNFVNAYPTLIGEIELNYENANAIETFDVTFTYDYWTTNITAGSVGANGAISGALGQISALTGVGANLASVFGG